MAVEQNKYPILEYDPEKRAIIEPGRHNLDLILPKRCVMTFLGDVVEKYSKMNNTRLLYQTTWEAGNVRIYSMEYKGKTICFLRVFVGAPVAVSLMEFIIAHGVEKIVACGGCGVFEEFEPGHILVPVSAVRDEGTSYHYMNPSREIELDRYGIEAAKRAVAKNGYQYTECKTWTTDAFYRETQEKVAMRKAEGCKCVEMECSALTAAAKFRGVSFVQLLYSGDIFKSAGYDEREWKNNLTAREKLFMLSLEACLEMN